MFTYLAPPMLYSHSMLFYVAYAVTHLWSSGQTHPAWKRQGIVGCHHTAGVLDVVATGVPPPLEEPLPLLFLIFLMSTCNKWTNVRSSNSPAGVDGAGAAELTATAGLLLLVLLAPV